MKHFLGLYVIVGLGMGLSLGFSVGIDGGVGVGLGMVLRGIVGMGVGLSVGLWYMASIGVVRGMKIPTWLNLPVNTNTAIKDKKATKAKQSKEIIFRKNIDLFSSDI